MTELEDPDLSGEFEDALKSGQPSANLDRIEKRYCASDRYDGIEYEFYGWYIPMRPIIDVVASKEDFAIEELQFVDESTPDNDLEPNITMFVADISGPNQPHPAFTKR